MDLDFKMARKSVEDFVGKEIIIKTNSEELTGKIKKEGSRYSAIVQSKKRNNIIKVIYLTIKDVKIDKGKIILTQPYHADEYHEKNFPKKYNELKEFLEANP